MPHLKLLVLGSPTLEQDGKTVELDTRKALALFVYLAVTGQSHGRDTLATLFWPENDQSQGRTYLRRALWLLKNALGEEPLVIERQNISLNHDADFWLDLNHFRHLLNTGTEHGHDPRSVCPDCLPSLTEAANLYRDDFLAGFTLPDCPEFDDWQFFQADSLRQEMLALLGRLVAGFTRLEDFESAISYARRRLSLDPWHEPAHRSLMQLYAWSGQEAAALRQYETCVRQLDEEFGLPPEPDTTALYETIKASALDYVGGRQRQRTGNEPVRSGSKQAPPIPPFLVEDDETETAPVFVARTRELAKLKAALASARAGQGQIIFLVGGAGRGKTQLAQEFSRLAQTEDEELIVVSGFCDAMTGIGDPYLPFRGALTMLTGDIEAKWAGGLISRSHARRLWESLPITLPALVHQAPDLIGSFAPAAALQEQAAAVASPAEPWFHQLNTLLTTERETGLEQQRIFSQYTALLKAIADQRPLLLIIEDLHWVDAASSGLLFHLSREIGDSRILILGTYRPEEVSLGWLDDQHPLAAVVSELKRQHGDIWLDMDDLMAVDGRHFVDAYLDTQPNKLDEAFREALFSHTGGYALFTVELLRDMQDRGELVLDQDGAWMVAQTIDWQTLPVKVEGVIEKRIERLDKTCQDSLTIASVEGEIFTAEVIARVKEMDERQMVQQLSRELDKKHRLISAQSLERVGQQRLSRYRFRHHLFQHYLYHTLDELERGYLHEAVGNVLELMFDGRTEEVAVQLAWHFQEAGLVTKAISYLQSAGDSAARVYAHTEAITSYRQALSLIKEHQVGQQHLTHLFSCLGRVLELSAQFDAALATYEEMVRRGQQLADPHLELAGFMAQVTLYATPNPIHDPIKGPALGQETLSLARKLGDQAAEAKTLWNLALGGMWSGRTHEGIVYAEQAVSLARKLDLTELLAYALNDLGMLYAAVLEVKQAIPTLYEAGSVWRQLDNLPMLTDNISMTAMAHVAAGDYTQAVALADEAFQISESHNNLWGQSYSRMMVCLAYWEFGEPERALKTADESIRFGKMAGFIASLVLAGGHKAAFLGSLGDIDHGLAAALEAVTIAESQFPHFRCHPLGVLVQLHLMAGNLDDAERLVQQAAEDAYREAHPTWNMRINIAEAELALKQGNFKQAMAIINRWLPRLRQNNLHATTPTMLLLQSEAQLALGQAEAAHQSLQEAQSIAEGIGAQATLWPILFALSRLETNPALAQQLHEQACAIVERIARNIGTAVLQDSFLNRPQVRDLLA